MPSLDIHPIGPVWCDNCEVWHSECEFGCCYTSTDNTATLAQIPNCDLCKQSEAYADGAMISGPWAYMCKECFRKHGVGIGLGKGQILLKSE